MEEAKEGRGGGEESWKDVDGGEREREGTKACPPPRTERGR